MEAALLTHSDNISSLRQDCCGPMLQANLNDGRAWGSPGYRGGLGVSLKALESESDWAS